MIVYKGPSRLNGKPIVAVLTLSSENRKTGDMAQLWILHQRKAPVEASNKGMDESVCGDCKMRRSLGGACYVNIGHGPQAVWAGWRRGIYVDNTALKAFPFLKPGRVRLGAYGDPAALPADVLHAVVSWFSGHVGYTHQWRRGKFQWLRGMVMASVDTLAEYHEAKRRGWRSFRVVPGYHVMERAERVCANDSHGTQCNKCMACHGGEGADIVIELHGSLASRVRDRVAAAAG